jgi:[ribosomal protein S5]-alanine N-acetyltransferase
LKRAGVVKRPTLTARGSRVYLRPVTAADAKEFIALHKLSRRHFGAMAVPTLTAGQFRENLALTQGPDYARFLICLCEDDRIIGDLGLSQIYMRRLRSAYLGYVIGAPYAGQGYMQEAATLILRYAFRTLKLNRVEANIQPGNRRSMKLALRMGFALEGYSRCYLKISNQWRDLQRWALLARDWKPQRSRRVSSQPAMTELEIRDLGLHDIAAFAVVRHQIASEGNFVPESGEAIADRGNFAEQVAHTLKDPLQKRILAFYRGRIIGFVIATRDDNERSRHAAHIAIGIVEAHTGRGVGRKLMDALEAWARASGVVRLDLRVMVHNVRAIALYQRCGFAVEGRLRGEFCVGGRLVDAYQMGKILD